MEHSREKTAEIEVNTTIDHAKSKVVLLPHPSNDPDDPLNWSMGKKIFNLTIVSLSSFIGITQALANQSGFFAQAKVYHKPPIELSYSVSSPTA